MSIFPIPMSAEQWREFSPCMVDVSDLSDEAQKRVRLEVDNATLRAQVRFIEKHGRPLTAEELRTLAEVVADEFNTHRIPQLWAAENRPYLGEKEFWQEHLELSELSQLALPSSLLAGLRLALCLA